MPSQTTAHEKRPKHQLPRIAQASAAASFEQKSPTKKLTIALFFLAVKEDTNINTPSQFKNMFQENRPGGARAKIFPPFNQPEESVLEFPFPLVYSFHRYAHRPRRSWLSLELRF